MHGASVLAVSVMSMLEDRLDAAAFVAAHGSLAFRAGQVAVPASPRSAGSAPRPGRASGKTVGTLALAGIRAIRRDNTMLIMKTAVW
jgi:hypothetical protein